MDADLTATPTIENGQVTGWQLCDNTTKTTATTANKDCGNGKSSSPYPKLNFAKGTADHHVSITIDSGNGITFAQTNPLWIQQDTKPTSPIVSPTSQIDPAKIQGAGTTTLKFQDKNSEAMLLKYQLNFAGGNGLMAIDPDIQNGGKGMPWYESSVVLVLAGAIALMLLVWIGMRWRANVARQSGTGSD
jgi:hypothetical protein